MAADRASLHGLNDLTIGDLARTTGMSKAGLHGVFGSKTELQLATIHFAAEVFTREVIVPGRTLPAGAERIAGFVRGWLAYVDRKVFPGGCFFGRVSMEGSSLPDEVNAEIRALFDRFRDYIVRELRPADSAGSSRPAATKAAQKQADQLLGLIVSYNWAARSLGNAETANHIRALIEERLGAN